MSPDRPHDEARGESGLPKSEARRRALDARGALPADERERLAAAVRARTLELPELAAAGTVMLFASFRTELDTMPIARWALDAGKRLCLPQGARAADHGRLPGHRPRCRPRPRQVEHPRAGGRVCPRCRPTRWTSGSCRGRRSTSRGVAAGTAEGSTTATCRSAPGRARRGSPSRSRRNWCRGSTARRTIPAGDGHRHREAGDSAALTTSRGRERADRPRGRASAVVEPRPAPRRARVAAPQRRSPGLRGSGPQASAQMEAELPSMSVTHHTHATDAGAVLLAVNARPVSLTRPSSAKRSLRLIGVCWPASRGAWAAGA